MYRLLLLFLLFAFSAKKENTSIWIRINWLGYQPGGVKVAVWCSKEEKGIGNLPAGRQGWELVEAIS